MLAKYTFLFMNYAKVNEITNNGQIRIFAGGGGGGGGETPDTFLNPSKKIWVNNYPDMG